jgi:DNA-binding IclR family transcriptional regulator
LGINQTTCTNIVKSLVTNGYLETVPGMKGYVIGPAPYYLTRNGTYRKELVEAAMPQLKALTEQMNETSLIAVLKYGEKLILAKVERESAFALNTNYLEQQEPYTNATGRLLTAFLSEKERTVMVKNHGLPGTLWDGINTAAELEDACSKIRERGYCITPDTSGELIGIAFPVFQDGAAAAALGLFLPAYRFEKQQRDHIIREMKKTADKISQQLLLFSSKAGPL